MFDVVGQNIAKDSFFSAIKGNRLSHAYLITGPKGSGKVNFSLYMASLIMCIGDEKPCYKCTNCRRIESGIHPDVKVIGDEKKSIGVEKIRDIINEINVKPFEGNKKVIIIKNADDITIQGQNAMLKTLEEPPINTFIILTAENDGQVLPTIKSRCQIIKFHRVSNEEIEEYLLSKGIDKSDASIAASLSGGVVGNALLVLKPEYMKLRRQTFDTLSKAINLNLLDALELYSFFAGKRDNINEVLDIMENFLRDMILVKISRNKENIINKDLYNEIVEESQKLSYNKLNGIIKIIQETRDRINKNANFQLALEVMLLNIQEV